MHEQVVEYARVGDVLGEFDVLAWWEELRGMMEDPSDFADAARALSDGEAAELEALVAAGRADGQLEAPLELPRPELALVALALAMLPRGDQCRMTSPTLAYLLDGVRVSMAVPLYLGDRLTWCVAADYEARGGYVPAGFPGLTELAVYHDGEGAWGGLPRLPEGLSVFTASQVRIDDGAVTVVARLTRCDIVAFWPPSQSLFLDACTGEVEALICAAAGVTESVNVLGARDGEQRPAYDLGGVAFGDLWVWNCALRGAVTARVLGLVEVTFDGLRARANAATVFGITGAGRLAAEELKVNHVEEWLPGSDARLAAFPGASEGALELAAPRIYEIDFATHVCGQLEEASFHVPRAPQPARPRAAARDVTYLGAPLPGQVEAGLPASAFSLADVLSGLPPGAPPPPQVRVASLVHSPAADLGALCLTGDEEPGGGAPVILPEARVHVDLLVVRPGAWWAEPQAWRGLLTAARLLAVGPDGAEDVEAGERMAASVGAARATPADAAAAGVPAHWLTRAFRY